MAADFLAALDPGAGKFTFQFFSDSGHGYAEVFHGSLDEVWPKVQAVNTVAHGIGVFVTINETDFRGRRHENIIRPRALFVDADGNDQIKRCRDAIRTSGAEPTMVVRSSPGRAHFYWCCDDLSLAAFSELQSALIQKLATDPAVKDLPRVMRLPGTPHLKEPGYPREVTFKVFNPQPWKVDELTLKLGLSALSTTKQQPKRTNNPYLEDSRAFTPADAERIRRLFGPLVGSELGGGLETNLEEIRSAVAAIPASAISTEHDWVKFTRGLAHEALVYEGQAEQLWEIVDAASRRAPRYDQIENRKRWLRYVDEALDRANPITIATVFDLAKQHGWSGWSPGLVTSASNVGAAGISQSITHGLVETSQPIVAGFAGTPQSITQGLAVTFANVPHRQFLYGVDFSRGEITVLAAPGGSGKSSYAIGGRISLVSNKALLGERIWAEKPKVLYINGEDGATENIRRMLAFA